MGSVSSSSCRLISWTKTRLTELCLLLSSSFRTKFPSLELRHAAPSLLLYVTSAPLSPRTVLTSCQVESITSITAHNATFIPEYLLPQLARLLQDTDVFVRATYARALVHIADAAVRMLELSEAAKPADAVDVPQNSESSYKAMLAEIQYVVDEHASILLVDNSSNVKRAVLAEISDLCSFFGRQRSSETVLSHIMTYLNDRDWQLRLAFFDGIVTVGAFIGIRAIDEFVLPLMLQALAGMCALLLGSSVLLTPADPEEAVVARVIQSLTRLTSLGLLQRMRLWDVFSAVHGFLYHPNIWIRQGAAGFVAKAASQLSPSDIWCILYPTIRPALRSDVVKLDEDSILSALVSPVCVRQTSMTS